MLKVPAISRKAVNPRGRVVGVMGGNDNLLTEIFQQSILFIMNQ
jgi:hypothetical protein